MSRPPVYRHVHRAQHRLSHDVSSIMCVKVANTFSVSKVLNQPVGSVRFSHRRQTRRTVASQLYVPPAAVVQRPKFQIFMLCRTCRWTGHSVPTKTEPTFSSMLAKVASPRMTARRSQHTDPRRWLHEAVSDTPTPPTKSCKYN